MTELKVEIKRKIFNSLLKIYFHHHLVQNLTTHYKKKKKEFLSFAIFFKIWNIQ